MEEEIYYGTGKRKKSIARVWLKNGNGKITINKLPIKEYLKRDTLESRVREVLTLTDTAEKFDIIASVHGGGLSGQAGAVKHGLSKAILHSDPGLRLTLKRAGNLTRDSRIKERKKPGQKGARKGFQFSKR